MVRQRLKFLNKSRTDFVRPKTYEKLLSKLNEDERVVDDIPQLHKGNYESKIGTTLVKPTTKWAMVTCFVNIAIV